MSACIPYVMISYSDDGGETFSHEIKKPLVTRENLLCRVIIRRQGSAYGRIYRVKNSDGISFTIVSAHADVSVGI